MSFDSEAIGQALGSHVLRSERLAGGDISGALRLDLADGRAVVAKSGPLVSIEAHMLRQIQETGAPTPRVLASDGEWLVMEYLEPKPCPARWDALTSTLRLLHRPQEQAFGWDDDYAFGLVAIENARCANWPQFWAERRLLCHVPHIDGTLAKRIESLARSTGDLLPPSPAAALLHGDLWGGNIVWGSDAAWLIDPACYFGDREVDLAMLTLFDHPPESFFASLDPEPGWKERQPLYRLWPWLVHLRLIGGSYRGAVDRELAALGF